MLLNTETRFGSAIACRVKIHTGDDFEINQRANSHLSDAVEWRLSGRTPLAPSNRRVGFLSRELRMAEVQQSEEATELVKSRTDGKSVALGSPIRDVTAPRRDRDYRALSFFLLPRIRAMRTSQICVIELDEYERKPTVY